VLPLSDLVKPRRWPLVTLALIAVNVGVWLFYELPHGVDSAVDTIGAHACSLDGSCPDGTPGIWWPFALVTSMFGHGSWAHIVGNMLFLGVFGPRIEDRLGRPRYLAMYLLAGLGADFLFDGTTLAFASADDAAVPAIGASGAISGVLGAYFLAYPFERVLIWVIPALFFRVPAVAALGVWFVLQALEGAYALSNPSVTVGTAFMAHVGGFVVGTAAILLAEHGAGPPLRARLDWRS
jgi:membrane associated rhomboid family serine protease